MTIVTKTFTSLPALNGSTLTVKYDSVHDLNRALFTFQSNDNTTVLYPSLHSLYSLAQAIYNSNGVASELILERFIVKAEKTRFSIQTKDSQNIKVVFSRRVADELETFLIEIVNSAHSIKTSVGGEPGKLASIELSKVTIMAHADGILVESALGTWTLLESRLIGSILNIGVPENHEILLDKIKVIPYNYVEFETKERVRTVCIKNLQYSEFYVFLEEEYLRFLELLTAYYCAQQ